jgi:hypothetical protein
MMNFVICTQRDILLEWVSQEGWDESELEGDENAQKNL